MAPKLPDAERNNPFPVASGEKAKLGVRLAAIVSCCPALALLDAFICRDRSGRLPEPGRSRPASWPKVRPVMMIRVAGENLCDTKVEQPGVTVDALFGNPL